jgi:hypothetical protein
VQALQLYVGTTALTMMAQNNILRLKSLRVAKGFPEDWPPTPEKAAEIARKRGITMMAGFAPIFRRISALAEGDFDRAIKGYDATNPKQVYMTAMGLKDPGVPPPPPISIYNNPLPGSSSSPASGHAASTSVAAPQGTSTTAGPQAHQQKQHIAPHTPPVRVSLSSLQKKGAGKR